MGMYTELTLGCRLSEKTPKVCLDALDFCINKRGNLYPKLEEFIDRYDLEYLVNSSSTYFGFNQPIHIFEPTFYNNEYILFIRSSCKNYDNQIEKFLLYLEPYINQGSGAENIYATVIYEEAKDLTVYKLN